MNNLRASSFGALPVLLALLAACDGTISAPSTPAAASLEVGAASLPIHATNVVASGAGYERVLVTWTDNANNETVFRVRRYDYSDGPTNGDQVIVGVRGPNSTSFVDSTVVIGGRYRYRVQTCNAEGCVYGGYSNLITVVAPPQRPANPAAVLVPIRTVNLTWQDSSSTETLFRVRRSVRGEGGVFSPFTLLFNVAANATAATDTSVVAGNVYRYQVQACNGGGCSSSTSVVVSVPSVPAAPTGAVATIESGHVDLAWTDNATNESSYLIRRSRRNLDGSYPPYTLIDTGPRNLVSYHDFSVDPSSTYRYYVQACNAGGCANSAIMTITVP